MEEVINPGIIQITVQEKPLRSRRRLQAPSHGCHNKYRECFLLRMTPYLQPYR